MASVVLTFSNITNNGKPCKDPIIFITGADNVAFPCGDQVDENGQIKLTVPDSLFGERQCITGVIKCAECDSCKEEEFKICLCDALNPCEACQDCVNGVCVDKCPDRKCVNGTCCDCETASDCGNGYICNGCSCVCPTGYKNSKGDCVECLTNQQCGPCEECKDGRCVSKCAEGLICGGNGDCECPPGTKYNIDTKKCERIECSRDADCAACETCIGGQCVPIVCPDGYKCVDGECIKWPCKDTKCENGADCGDGCGCLNGECTPCYLLDCADEAASCQGALGCQCNGDKCEPVDNCKQYCDGSTPCLDTNCTCYNNECVSCKNFPCDPDQCSDKYNCECQNGNCEGGGGDGCNDTFNLVKKENCEADGCELEATFTTEKGCKCDPIEFKTKNIFTIPADTPTAGRYKLLELEVEMLKNGVKYSNFRNSQIMGDDELVDATIKTTVTHRVNNTIVTPLVSQVADVSPDGDNVIPTIPINFSHVVSTYNGSATKVTIEVRAESVKVPNNSCTDYKSEVIATYELDFTNNSTWTITKNTINGAYKAEVSKKLNDNTSTRRPLFIWYKSNTGTFGPNKYVNNGTYAQNGFFRKEYGVNSGGAWKDKINNPAAQSLPDQPNELWNNLNYKATVDCGCGTGNSAVLTNVVFCCTKKITYTLSECNRKITIPPFSVCSVNKNLSLLNSSGYKVPTEAQTYFWMVINGNKEILLRTEGGEVITSAFNYTHDAPIETIKFEQRYKGSPLVPVACPTDYDEPYTGPDYNVTTECGKVVVTKKTQTPNIASVTGKIGNDNVTFTPSQNGATWTAVSDLLKQSKDVEITVAFEGSCTLTKKASIVCDPDMEVIPTDFFAKGECPGGVNPAIVAEVKQGFTAAVKFSRDGVNYVSPDTTNPIKKTFTNFPAGTHTIYAKETINGVEYIITKTVTINPTLQPTVSKTDVCGTANGSIQILGGAPNSTWKITGPGLNGFQVALGANGNSNVVNILPTFFPTNTASVKYLVELVNDPSGATCSPKSEEVTINKGGGSITPTIEFAQNSFCQWQEVAFRIVDGGAGLTYSITATNGTITDANGNTITTLKAVGSSGPFDGRFIATGSSAAINITGITGTTNCYTLSTNPLVKQLSNVTFPQLSPGPKIDNINVTCSPDVSGTYRVEVKVLGSASSVTIGGGGATVAGSCGTNCQIWAAYDVQLFLINGEVSVVANGPGGFCSDADAITSLPECPQSGFCPPNGSVQIAATPEPPTCGQQNVTVGVSYTTLGNLTGEQYEWYEISGSSRSLVSSGTIVGTNPPPISVLTEFTPKSYELVITTKGACPFTSNEIVATAGTNIVPEILGPGISPDTTLVESGNTYSYSTGLIPGATYTWTLTNFNGSNQPIGTNSNVVNISNFTGGVNTINVTVTVGTCTATASATVGVGLSCATVDIQYLPGTGDNSCKNLGFTINNVPTGVTPTNYTWYVGSTPTQSGSGTPVNFDASVIPNGITENVRLEVIFSNGCTASSNVISYTRCSCICNGTQCLSLIPSNLNIDSTFDSYNGATISCQYNGDSGNALTGDWQVTNGTPDVWNPTAATGSTIDFTSGGCTGCNNPGFYGLAYGMGVSSQGGKFVAAGVWNGGEEISTISFATQIGDTYTITFEQAFAGNGHPGTPNTGNCTDNPPVELRSQVGDEAFWRVFFGTQFQDAPSRTYQGAGSQTWTSASLTFTATSTSTQLKFKAMKGLSESPSNSNNRYYMALDNIQILGGPTCP